ncbi:hypothetical protein C1645_566211 [Glomus cerebriforme]|uniref:Uncharacterized protein n=1 Tax=Glomus cerebriforme TaxID=658196 RepID=A0A397S4F3_9GLOM|nr:hypothetical protein C1645_566211 [Glomus cerebriforme]
MSNRRSSRLADKQRINYNEEEPAIEVEAFDEETNEIQNVEIVNLAYTPQYTFSSYKKGRSKTKVNRALLQKAANTLSELKFALESTKSAAYSFENFLKNKKKINHNQPEQIQDFRLREHDLMETEPSMPNPSKRSMNDDAAPRKRPKQPILPRFTLKLSDDLKKTYRPKLPNSTSLEDTEIIVYDSADPDFDNDDSIITIAEHKQNMIITKKISLNKRTSNEGLLSSTNTHDQMNKGRE